MDPKPNKGILQGRWNDINIRSRKKITARYDKIKDWRLDPKGYFLINVDKKKKRLRVGYCKINKSNNSSNHDMIAEVLGKTALEVINTLIAKKFLSTLQHAGDMGIELCKAELSLKYNLKYTQDQDLKIYFK
jgi:hypothetical protein